MPKHYKPERAGTTHRKLRTPRATTARTARDAGRKLLLFGAGAIVIVLAGVWWLMR